MTTPRQGPLIAHLLAQICFGLLAMTLCIPSMQEWAQLFADRASAVPLTFSAYVVAYGGFQVVFGPLSDRHGRRRMLMIGLVVALVGALVSALAQDLSMLLLGRFLQGAGGAAGMVVGRSMVQDLFDGPQRTRVMAYVGMALGCIPPLATLLGGQIHVRLGWRWNFILLVVIAVVLWLWAWRSLPARKPHAVSSASPVGVLQSYARLMAEPVFLKYVLILAVTTATFYTFLSGAPLVLGSYGVGPERVGLFIMWIPLAYFCGNFLTTHLIHRLGERRVMHCGQASTLGGLCLMVLLILAGAQSPWAVALPLIFVGLGHGLMIPPTLSATVSVVPALAGAAAGAAGVMQQFTGALGGYLVGWVPHDTALWMGLMMLGFAALGLVTHVSLFSRRRGHHRP